MDAFVELTGDREAEVARRLALDPKLVELAAWAATTRVDRKKSGKTAAIEGFTLLGLGDIAGAAIIATTPGYPDHVQDYSQVLLGLGVGLASMGIGLGLAIPGLVKAATLSEDESHVLDYYDSHRIATPVPTTRPSTETPGVAFHVPLFSVAF